MRVPRTLPRGFATRLLRSRKRLDVLQRQVIVEPLKADELAHEAVSLQRELALLAAATEGSTRASIEAMADNVRALERKYTEASASLYYTQH